MEKYIIIKQKYISLKRMIGGGNTSSKIIFEDTIIPSIYVDYTDIILPHNNIMYKTMVRIYLSIIVKVVSSHGKFKKDEKDIIPSDPPLHITTSVPNRPRTLKWVICKNPSNLEDLEDVNFEEFKTDLLYYPISQSVPCFIPGCGGIRPVNIFTLDKLAIICFGIGVIENTYPVIITNVNLFLIWLETIRDIVINCNQILLCGHSNGMNAATICTFILLYLKNNSFMSEFTEFVELNKELFTELNKIKDKWVFLENIELFIIGTGGFPCLFTNENQFKIFYDLLDGKYLHIVLADYDSNKLDGHIAPLYVGPYTFNNYKIAVYRSKTKGYTTCEDKIIFTKSDAITFNNIDESLSLHELSTYRNTLWPHFFKIT